MTSDDPFPPEPPRGSVISRAIHRGAELPALTLSPSLLPPAPRIQLFLCLEPRRPCPVRRSVRPAGAGRRERGGAGAAGRTRAARNGGGGGMGWALLGVGLLLALYTLLRHGLRGAPRPRARPELRGRTAIVTGERPAGSRDGPRCGPCPRSAPRSAPQGEAAASARPRRWSSLGAGPALSWRPAAPGGERPPPAASAG